MAEALEEPSVAAAALDTPEPAPAEITPEPAATEATPEAAIASEPRRPRPVLQMSRLPLRPKPPRLNWSRSGGPAVARKSAGRATTATVIAIAIGPRKAHPPPWPASRAMPRRANATGADGAPSQQFRKLRADAPGAAPAAADGAPAAPREDKAQPPCERFQGRDKGRDNDKGRDRDKDRGKFGGGRDKGGRDKGGRDRDKGRDAVRRTGNTPPAPPRASAIVRSIAIRPLRNWRRSRNSSPPTARTDEKRFQAKW